MRADFDIPLRQQRQTNGPAAADRNRTSRTRPVPGAAAAARMTRRVSKLRNDTIVRGQAFYARLAHAQAGMRRHRAAMEEELFRGSYTLSTKNDDELPMIR